MHRQPLLVFSSKVCQFLLFCRRISKRVTVAHKQLRNQRGGYCCRPIVFSFFYLSGAFKFNALRSGLVKYQLRNFDGLNYLTTCYSLYKQHLAQQSDILTYYINYNPLSFLGEKLFYYFISQFNFLGKFKIVFSFSIIFFLLRLGFLYCKHRCN